MDYDTPRYVTMGVGLAMIGSSVVVQMFVERYIKTGIIKFTPGEIMVKMKGGEPQIFLPADIEKLVFVVTDFEGEDKATDMLTARGRATIRSGEENSVTFTSKGSQYRFQFKLESAFQKQRVLHFLNILAANTGVPTA